MSITDRWKWLALVCSVGLAPACADDGPAAANGPHDDGETDGGADAGTESGAGADANTDSTSDGGAETPIAPWIVFSRADSTVPMGNDLLTNADFEAPSPAPWQAYQQGFEVAPGAGRNGTTALKLERAASDSQGSGAYQSVPLDQPVARPLYFSGWVKSEAMTGTPDRDFSIYIDAKYVTLAEDPVHGCDPATEGPCSLYGQVTSPAPDTGTHDWQLREGFLTPAHPIKSLTFDFLLRGAHDGTAWIDDFKLAEVPAELVTFDGQFVAAQRPADFTGGSPIDLSTTDGLTLSLWSRGGAVREATLDSTDVLDDAFDFTGGLFVHEADARDYVAPGGVVTQQGSTVVHHGVIPSLSLEMTATYTAEADRITAHLEAHDTSGKDRPVTVYWALPITLDGGWWGDDPRRAEKLAGATPFSNTTAFWFDKLGATGEFSRYPFGTVFDDARGVALGYPVDQPRVARLAYQPITHQLFLALDVGLTSATTKSPGTAATDIVLFRTRPAGHAEGFRSALAGFQSRYAAHFARRMPPEKEGLWNAFDDLSKMVHGPGESIDDFHFGVHEASVSYSAFDDAHGIQTFRYLTEPGSTWLQIPDAAGVDPADYAQTMAYLKGLYASGTPTEKTLAEKTLSSGIFDPAQQYAYEPYASGPPWCTGKCALFYLSPLPGIAEPPYALDQASYAWNDAAKQVYTTTPGLDGDYLDSFTMAATTLNYRRSHLAAAGVPPTWAHDAPHAIGMPVIFSTVEFARKVKSELPAGKLFIANGGVLGIPFGADLFDFTGMETKWLKDVNGTWTLVPTGDDQLTYSRAMSGARPYGLLMNVDFDHMSNAMVEEYMQTCLFYGIYPSMFSANASSNTYFSNPTLYNRDRPLFKKYVPLIQALSKAGWEPLTKVAASTADELYVERWGAWPGKLYVTLRNVSAADVTATLTFDRQALGLGSSAAKLHSLLLGASESSLAAAATTHVVSVPSGGVELLEVAP